MRTILHIPNKTYVKNPNIIECSSAFGNKGKVNIKL